MTTQSLRSEYVRSKYVRAESTQAQPTQAQSTQAQSTQAQSIQAETHSSIRDQVIHVGHRLSTQQWRLVHLVAELDRSGEWQLDGAATCSHWVARALDVEVCTAREWLRVGTALNELPVIDEAFAAGRLSYSKVRTITRVANADNAAELCDLAERTRAGHLTRAIAAWLGRDQDPDDTERRQHESRSLRWWHDTDGMVVGSFRLPPSTAAVFIAMIEAWVLRFRPVHRTAAGSGDALDSSRTGTDGDASTDALTRTDGHASTDACTAPAAIKWPSLDQQRADALVDLIGNGGGNVTTEVILHVRAGGATLDDGTPVSGSAVERIAPAAFIRTMIHDAESHPINVSGRHRHPTDRQKRVVRERDRGCVDCGSTELIEYDHVPDFEASKRTVIDELHVRCPACHRARHRRQGSGQPLTAAHHQKR